MLLTGFVSARFQDHTVASFHALTRLHVCTRARPLFVFERPFCFERRCVVFAVCVRVVLLCCCVQMLFSDLLFCVSNLFVVSEWPFFFPDQLFFVLCQLFFVFDHVFSPLRAAVHFRAAVICF